MNRFELLESLHKLLSYELEKKKASNLVAWIAGGSAFSLVAFLLPKINEMLTPQKSAAFELIPATSLALLAVLYLVYDLYKGNTKHTLKEISGIFEASYSNAFLYLHICLYALVTVSVLPAFNKLSPFSYAILAFNILTYSLLVLIIFIVTHKKGSTPYLKGLKRVPAYELISDLEPPKAKSSISYIILTIGNIYLSYELMVQIYLSEGNLEVLLLPTTLSLIVLFVFSFLHSLEKKDKLEKLEELTIRATSGIETSAELQKSLQNIFFGKEPDEYIEQRLIKIEYAINVIMHEIPQLKAQHTSSRGWLSTHVNKSRLMSVGAQIKAIEKLIMQQEQQLKEILSKTYCMDFSSANNLKGNEDHFHQKILDLKAQTSEAKSALDNESLL